MNCVFLVNELSLSGKYHSRLAVHIMLTTLLLCLMVSNESLMPLANFYCLGTI